MYYRTVIQYIINCKVYIQSSIVMIHYVSNCLKSERQGAEISNLIVHCPSRGILSATYLSKFLTEVFSAILLNLEYLSKVPCENQPT